MIVFNQDLVNDLARKRAVLFLGSGVSASTLTRAGRQVRDWATFLRHAASKLANDQTRVVTEQLIDRGDYLTACEIIKENLDLEIWRNTLVEEFAQIAAPSSLHRAIISLRQRIIITTNFDKLVESVWGEVEAEATHFPTIITKLEADIFRILRDEQPYIIKLHGSIDEPDGMIFARSDYAKRAFGNWVYTEFLRAMLLTHTFIFIGFSLSDPAVTNLIEDYAQRYPASRPHYIFLPGPIPDEMIDISKRLRRLFVIPYDKADDHRELTQLLEKLAGDADEQRRAVIAASIPALGSRP